MPEPANTPGQPQAIGSASNQTISFLVSAMRNGDIIPRPPFQRRLVWTPKHKAEFIATVLENYPFPEIYLANGEVDVDTGKTIQLLVDGQQRMTTLKGYMDNSEDLKLPSSFTRYKDLTVDKKKSFLNYKVAVRDLGNITYEVTKEIFKRINQTQYSLNETEKLNAAYDGDLKAFALGLAEHPFFTTHSIFTIADRRRMRDLSFALTITISSLSGYFRRDEAHESYLETFNVSFPDRESFITQINHVFSIIDACQFPTPYRVWNQTELLNLIVELHATLYKDQTPIEQDKLSSSLKAFYNAVDSMNASLGKKDVSEAEIVPVGHDADVFNYLKAATSRASSDKYTRATRGDIIRKVILGAWPELVAVAII